MANLKIGLTDFKPYSSLNPETGLCAGSAVQIAKQLMSEYNYNVEGVCASPTRIFRLITNGQIDLALNIKSTVAINDKVTFTQVPFTSLVLNLYTQRNLRDNNKFIAVIRGYDYDGYKRKFGDEGFEFIEVPDNEDAIRLFMNKRVNYLLAYEAPFKHYLKELEAKDLSFTQTNYNKQQLSSVDTYYAISKASRYHDSLVKVFSKIDQAKVSKYHLEIVD